MWQLWKNYDIINKKYKGGNYMKRYISILIISTILLSLASCKKIPDDTIGADIQAQGVQTDAPEQNEKQEQPESPTENP